MEKRSFIREISRYLLCQAILLIFVVGFFLMSSFNILEKEIISSSNTLIDIYGKEIDHSISNINDMVLSVTLQKEELEKLKSPNENEREISAVILHDYMQKIMQVTNEVDALIVYDDTYNICLDAVSKNIRYDQKIQLRKYTAKVSEDNSEILNKSWGFLRIKDATYLHKNIKFNGRIVALYIKMENFLSTLETQKRSNRMMFLVDRNNKIGKVWGEETEEVFAGSNMNTVNRENYYYPMEKKIADSELVLCCYVEKAKAYSLDMGMILVGVVACTSLLFLFFIIGYTKRTIFYPMKLIMNDMEAIRNGAYSNRVNGVFETSEFQMLQMVTNQMIDEIVGLKIQTYEKKIELQNMQLKSIRLQLKPHFFLNALTTISSLSTQNENIKIKKYIDSLSKNIRYMFRAGLHTVSVREEIQHVDNYFEMQQLKYPDFVFYMIDLPEELAEWKIPQMLIHTFIENEYKYAVSMDHMLTILIKVSTCTYQEEEMLLIEIEDDGKGYPQDVLEYMGPNGEASMEKEDRTGLLSIKRLMQLMYEQENLVVISNKLPHGCLNRIYVPKDTKHELK